MSSLFPLPPLIFVSRFFTRAGPIIHTFRFFYMILFLVVTWVCFSFSAVVVIRWFIDAARRVCRGCFIPLMFFLLLLHLLLLLWWSTLHTGGGAGTLDFVFFFLLFSNIFCRVYSRRVVQSLYVWAPGNLTQNVRGCCFYFLSRVFWFYYWHSSWRLPFFLFLFQLCAHDRSDHARRDDASGE